MLALLLSAASSTCTPNAALVEATQHLAEGDDDAAHAALDRGVERGRGCPSDVLTAYRVLGELGARTQDWAICRRAAGIVRALGGTPLSNPRNCPPEYGRFELTLGTVTRVAAEKPAVIRFRLQDDFGLARRVRVHVRTAPDRPYSASTDGVEDRALVIPAILLPAADEPYRLQYYVELLDPRENVLVRVGDPERPRQLAVETTSDAWGAPMIIGVTVWSLVSATALTTGVLAGVGPEKHRSAFRSTALITGSLSLIGLVFYFFAFD